MLAYIGRRLLIMPIIVIGVTLLIFAMLMLLSPVERASLYVSDVPRTSSAIQDIIEKYGLNEPIHLQYFRWMGQVVRGNLGWSKTAQMSVTRAIAHYAPVSLELAMWSIVPIIGIGIWFGVVAATHQDSIIDHAARFFSIVGWSFPTFVFGLLMLMIFYAQLDWFPPERLSQWAKQVVRSPEFTEYTRMYTVDSLINLRLDIFLDAIRHLFLPVITLSYLSWALILRVVRSSMLEALREDYVTTARAKGLTEKRVVERHARPNALIPVATIGGLVFIGLVNGVVITEVIFNIRGMGWFIATAALQLDVVSVLGLVLFNSLIIIFGNLAVDILYGFLDPRVRLE